MRTPPLLQPTGWSAEAGGGGEAEMAGSGGESRSPRVAEGEDERAGWRGGTEGDWEFSQIQVLICKNRTFS